MYFKETLESAKKREEAALYNSATQAESSDEHSAVHTRLETRKHIPVFKKSELPKKKSSVSVSNSREDNDNSLSHPDVLLKIEQKVDKLDENSKILASAMKESFADIFTEIFAIKKALSNISEDRKYSKFANNKENDYFPIRSNKDFNNINSKLNNENCFNDIKFNLTKQFGNEDEVCDSAKDFFKKILPSVFHKSFVPTLTWVAHEGKTAISSSKLVEVIQSKSIVLIFLT